MFVYMEFNMIQVTQDESKNMDTFRMGRYGLW